jgi:DNA repair protein RadA/Sms
MAEMRLNVQRGFKAGTRISTIKVPEELRQKHSTGLDWFDDALGGEGGFTRTSTMMLTGGPGCGKSTLVRQLADSMTKAGHVVVYNSGEESLFQAKMACERLGLKNDFMVAEEKHLPTLLAFLDTVRKANPNKVIILLQDSLQTLDDGKYKDGGTTGNTPVRCTEMLVDWMQKNYGLCVMVGQCTKGGDFAGKNTIRHAVDVHGHLEYDFDKKSDTYGCLLFEVSKNRWGCNGRTYIVGLTKTGMEERGSFSKAELGRKTVGEDEGAFAPEVE